MFKNVIERFKANATGYFQQFRVLLVLTLLAAVLDALSTIHFMSTEGADQEVHPAIRIVSAFLGPVAGPIVGKICQLLATVVVTIYLRSYAKYILLVVIILYAWAAWYNVWGRHLYVPRLLNRF